MKIHNDLEQGTEEWFKARNGKMTASNAHTISVAGKGLDTYIAKIVSDMFAAHKEEGYKSKEMERGSELESQAKAIYELEHSLEIENVGFIEYSSYVGCSPDGLIGESGGIEIKCINNASYFKLLIGEEEPDSGYVWQCMMCLMITNRAWWDLVFYNPNFKKSTIVFRILPDAAKINKLKIGLAIGEEKINALISKFEKHNI